MPFITGYISNETSAIVVENETEVSMPFITGYISNRNADLRCADLRGFQCPLSRATFQTLALGMPLFTRFKSHFAGESKFFPANLPFYV